MHWKEVRVQFDFLEGSRDDQVVTFKNSLWGWGVGGCCNISVHVQ